MNDVHEYPSNYRPGTHWATDAAWQILDSIKPGVISTDARAFLAGQIAGRLMREPATGGRMNDAGLARLFAELWSFFVDGGSIDGFDLEKMIERTGLAEWREATEADVTASHLEIEVGDPLLCLTEEGRRIIGSKT